MINPNVVKGQIAGGVVQGIGGVFFEHFRCNDAGNPTTTTFMDYLLPTADANGPFRVSVTGQPLSPDRILELIDRAEQAAS